MPRWLIKKEGSVALSTNTFEHWTHVLTWTFYRHHLFGKAMCSYEIGHSNNPAIKQSTYKLYQPKIYSAQISSPPQQSKALLQRDNAKPFLFWRSQVCLPPRNTSTWHSWGIFPTCSNRSKNERAMGKEKFCISLLVTMLQSISLDQNLLIPFLFILLHFSHPMRCPILPIVPVLSMSLPWFPLPLINWIYQELSQGDWTITTGSQP